MLQSAFKLPSEHLGLPSKREPAPKPRLPTKRKRDTICGLGDFDKLFTIKQCPNTPYDKPHTFKPIRIIGRSQLPLSFLDTSADDNFAANRAFSANIDILEKHNEWRLKENAAPRILIARCESKKTLYAIERVQAHVYSLCKLAAWLKEKDVSELWDPENLNTYPRLFQIEGAPFSHGEWWGYAVVDASPAERPEKRIRTSMIRQPKLKSDSAITHTSPQYTDTAQYGKAQPKLLSTEVDMQDMQPPTPLTPQEQLESLVAQYLNAVYMSKTSLAYFAKGPIARIRNAFTSPEEGAAQTYELVAFLRAMLLGHKAQEKKYAEKLHEVIKAIPPGSFSDEDTPKKPRKSKKKVKLSAAGMYPQEADVVKKWWVGEVLHGNTHGEETIDQRIKRRLADLRVREALAQMILMLEIISLEALHTYKKPAEDAGATKEPQGQVESQSKPKRRKKKLDDINLLLDLLLDKLCIWQSVEEAGVMDFDAPMSKQGGGASDRLQSFCVEVIVPFYMNRLPEQARMVNKRLGGPATSSPPKRKAMRPPTTSRKSGDSKEPEPKKVRRSLARVSTDTTGQTSQRRAPSLARSTTDSALINGIKREGSEIRLSAIPFQRERSPSQAARRSMSRMKVLQNREIDLESTSAAAEAKKRQKKRVEEEEIRNNMIKDAITALKKPNRGLAAGSYADESESRSLGLSNKSRKPTTTVRRIQKDVQVSATPRAVRRVPYDRVDQTPMHHRNNPFRRPREADAPPSSDFCIPSSGVRPASSIVTGTVQRSATIQKFAEPSIMETPSRPAISKSFAHKSSVDRMLFATPNKSLKKLEALSPDSPVQVDATPTKIGSSPPEALHTTTPRLLFATTSKSASKKSAAVFATPLKPASKAPSMTTTPKIPYPSSANSAKDDEEPSTDLFDALGWNDDGNFL